RNLSAEGLRALLPKHKSIEVTIAKGPEVRETTRRLVSSGADRIVAAGGDGTISAVAGVLAGKDIPLGILPLGTFNHFARDNGIPFDLPAAIRTATEGQARAVDVGEVNGHVFINSSSVGIYPAAVKRRDDYINRVRVRKWVAMALGVASVFHRFSPFTVKLETETVKIERITPFVFVGNNAYSFDLLKLLRRFTLTGGQLSLYTAHWDGRWSILRLALMAILGLLRQEKDFEMYAAEEVRLETRRTRVRVAADGEIFHMSTPLHFRIRPGDLKVIVPN
ncbi:MAG TPA: diacylglycerol kinase family protein, partial [Syntrophales bacterium]